MEAFRTLISGDLPPAGNSILATNATGDLPGFPGYFATWVDSGTSALALALLELRRRNPQLHAPEVIIPGYCCPDLIAAAQFAGVKAVLVDISTNDPGFNLEELAGAIHSQTLAVIAVNFLGVKENLGIIADLLEGHPHVSLIEDNAQWFPSGNELESLTGDFVVFSFGRGKPVSLLGGGLLLSRLPADISAVLPVKDASTRALKLKYCIYNQLLKPQLYQLVNRNPLIKLGETRYHPLSSIGELDELRLSLLPQNLKKYHLQIPTAEEFYDHHFSSQLFANCLIPLNSSRRKRLLRYPLLCKTQTIRDQLMTRLTRAGLGSSCMYQRPLMDIEGVEEKMRLYGNQNNAVDFAQRLITLPVHEGVTEKHLHRILKEIQALPR